MASNEKDGGKMEDRLAEGGAAVRRADARSTTTSTEAGGPDALLLERRLKKLLEVRQPLPGASTQARLLGEGGLAASTEGGPIMLDLRVQPSVTIGEPREGRTPREVPAATANTVIIEPPPDRVTEPMEIVRTGPNGRRVAVVALVALVVATIMGVMLGLIT